jgi:hypothetical protein
MKLWWEPGKLESECMNFVLLVIASILANINHVESRLLGLFTFKESMYLIMWLTYVYVLDGACDRRYNPKRPFSWATCIFVEDKP